MRKTETGRAAYHWDTLPAIPGEKGFAGSFAGVSNGALLVAGGSNFPGSGTPWNGGVKTWYDKVFVLEDAKGRWKEAGTLPRPLGYGVSITTGDGLLCIGGSNAEGHYADVFLLRWKNGALETIPFPPLPFPLANSCGAMAGKKIYVAGGLRSPGSLNAAGDFYLLDLSASPEKLHWQELPTWPGMPRMLAVAGVSGESFFVFSGAGLQNGARSYLTDAWRYDPAKGWKACAPMPAPTVAAPTPAATDEYGTIRIFGGDNGADAANAATLRERHPGFSDSIHAYDPVQDAWSISGRIPTDQLPDAAANPNSSLWAPVTTPLTRWNGLLVMPGGEVRPGTRTPRVRTAE
ncbi:galactose oxidase [Chitinophaga rhizosphaerae]|uniref:galactose oxidase n=1 Tax=Chitinophaga rhizosphaerae TaxID=1864947 RepID=UPI000F80A469|nr:galactose oxidase [Chitinophaga rhizosphaerae]